MTRMQKQQRKMIDALKKKEDRETLESLLIERESLELNNPYLTRTHELSKIVTSLSPDQCVIYKRWLGTVDKIISFMNKHGIIGTAGYTFHCKIKSN